jgi:hypothetical protein
LGGQVIWIIQIIDKYRFIYYNMIVSEYMKIWKGTVMIDEHSAQLFKLQAGICKTLADSTGFQCYEESGEKIYRIWVKDINMGDKEIRVSEP